MWSYFKKEKKANARRAKSGASAFNWCLFIPKDLTISSGVFFSSIGPGIKDHKNGVLYIAPEKYMPKIKLSRLSSSIARKVILEYYGIYDHKPQVINDNFLGYQRRINEKNF